MRKSLRPLLLLAACVLVAVVLRDYLGSRRMDARLMPELLPVLPEEVAAQAQSWRWTQTTGDSTHIEVRADGFVQDAEGTETDLRGVVLRIFHVDSASYDRVESAAMRMLEDGKLFSEGETTITLGIPQDGGEESPVVVTTSGVTFEPTDNRAHTDRAVRYKFRDSVGRSQGATYDAVSGMLRMQSQAYLERHGASQGVPDTRIWAGELHYSEQAARIALRGGARIERGRRWLECESGLLWLDEGRVARLEADNAIGGEDALGRESRFATRRLRADFGPGGTLERIHGHGDTKFESSGGAQHLTIRAGAMDLHYALGASTGESELRRAEAREAAQAYMGAVAEEGFRNSLESDVLVLHMAPGQAAVDRVVTLRRGRLEQRSAGAPGPSRTLEAGRIQVNFGPGSRIEGVTGQGDARLVQRDSQDGATALKAWSEGLVASFDSDTEEILEIHQSGGFRFEEGGRRGRAAEARFDVVCGLVALQGKATVSGQGSTVSARRIELVRATGRLEAEGDMAAALSQSGAAGEVAPRVGLFSAQEPVYATADALTSDPESGRLEYRGRARLWQRHHRVDADAITIDRSSRSLAAQGRVSMTWSEPEAVNSEEPATVSVRAASMRYEEPTRIATFTEQVDFQRGGMRVRADRLQAVLAAGELGGRLESALASGAVQIAELSGDAGSLGFGDQALYRPSASEIVLTGQPARVVNVDGAEARGASLTYRTAGDRLLVLGQGAERAYSYRPSPDRAVAASSAPPRQ